MSWRRGLGTALAIVAYFFVATVWLPDRITRMVPTSVLRDIMVVLAWAAGLTVGMWLLRKAQRRGAI